MKFTGTFPVDSGWGIQAFKIRGFTCCMTEPITIVVDSNVVGKDGERFEYHADVDSTEWWWFDCIIADRAGNISAWSPQATHYLPYRPRMADATTLQARAPEHSIASREAAPATPDRDETDTTTTHTSQDLSDSLRDRTQADSSFAFVTFFVLLAVIIAILALGITWIVRTLRSIKR